MPCDLDFAGVINLLDIDMMRMQSGKASTHLARNSGLRGPAVIQDEVLIAGFGRRGHAVGDIPGVRFKVGLKFLIISIWTVQWIPLY